MQKWLRNILVVIVSVITFGVVTPAFAYDEQTIDTIEKKRDVIESINKIIIEEQKVTDETLINVYVDPIEELIREGQIQAFKKFGPRIQEMIGTEFEDIILPQIEFAIKKVANQFAEEELSFLTITQNPGKGISEKIFHVRNSLTNEDIIRFHVRRDNPPQQGYWFNFHYHTYHDDFVTHYDLGNIYWAKDTPPKWMS